MSISMNITEIKTELTRLSKFDMAKKMLDWGQEMITRDIRLNAPNDTGEYSKSWKKSKPTKEKFTVTTNMGQLYLWLEFTGTKPHEIKPIRAKALHWINDAGQDVFAKKVWHPGTTAEPHVQPALKKFYPKWRDYIFKEIKREYGWIS